MSEYDGCCPDCHNVECDDDCVAVVILYPQVCERCEKSFEAEEEYYDLCPVCCPIYEQFLHDEGSLLWSDNGEEAQ